MCRVLWIGALTEGREKVDHWREIERMGLLLWTKASTLLKVRNYSQEARPVCQRKLKKSKREEARNGCDGAELFANRRLSLIFIYHIRLQFRPIQSKNLGVDSDRLYIFSPG